MHTPLHDRESDRNKILAFMREYSFATLVTSSDDNLKATHLPFLIETRDNAIVLSSQLAQANDQWRDFDELGAGDAEARRIPRARLRFCSPARLGVPRHARRGNIFGEGDDAVARMKAKENWVRISSLCE